MAGYQAPKRRLHREFLYLDHETVLNSLSAIEAGKIDKIIQKVSQAREGGLEAALAAGPVRGGGKRKKVAEVEEELVKTRTWFSAFEEWYRHLSENGGIGMLYDAWDEDVRDALRVGDTLEFTADVTLAPLHKLIRTFVSFADRASSGMFGELEGAQLTETKESAAMMATWLGGSSKRMSLPVYLRPVWRRGAAHRVGVAGAVHHWRP